MSMNNHASILLIEDEAPISHFIQTSLRAEGHEVHAAATAREGEAMAGNRRVDLFLIDLGLPDDDGVHVIRRLRQWTQRPIIVLSARALEMQKVQALDAGADDYIVKPFGVAELHARVRVAQRHAAQTTQGGDSIVHCGADVRVDLRGRTVHRGGQAVRLTATEWRLLEALARRADRIVTTRQLLADVWGPSHTEQVHYLRIYVRNLRLKLEADPANPAIVLTDAGLGYRLISSRAA